MDNPEENRFSEENYKNNYYPCVGHYDAYKGEKYEKEKNNLRYDSLYNRTRILFNDKLLKKNQDKGFMKFLIEKKNLILPLIQVGMIIGVLKFRIYLEK